MKAIRDCGHHAINPEGLVGVKVTHTATGRKAGFAGLATCGSVWACPTCNAKIATRRAEELAAAVRQWERLGGHTALVTLTMRHDKDQSLALLWASLSYAWSKATSGRGFQHDSAEHGTVILGKKRLPWVRSVEVTHGGNGWHVHVHALMFLKGQVDLQRLGESMFARWSRALQRKGLRAPIQNRGGLDVKALVTSADNPAEDSASYLVKTTYAYTADNAGWEVAGGAMKDARGTNRAAFRILRDFVATGDLSDLDLWHEYEKASRGRMQLTWSRGFRDYLRLEAEKTDEEIAAEELGGDTIQTIPADEWRAVRHRQASILRAAEILPLDTLKTHPVSTWLIALDAFEPKGSP